MPPQVVENDLPEYELVVRCGQPFSFTLPLLQGDDVPVPSGAVIAARAEVRENYRAEVVIHSWDIEVLNVDGDAHVRLFATSEQTASWQDTWPTRYAEWDLEVTDVDGDPHRMTDICKVRLRPRISQ